MQRHYLHLEVSEYSCNLTGENKFASINQLTNAYLRFLTNSTQVKRDEKKRFNLNLLKGI